MSGAHVMFKNKYVVKHKYVFEHVFTQLLCFKLKINVKILSVFISKKIICKYIKNTYHKRNVAA